MLKRSALIVAAIFISVAVGAWTHGNVSVAGDWILLTNVWNDSGVWKDTSAWQD